MDINSILVQYDSMFANNTPEEIEDFLAEQVAQAEQEGDRGALLTLLNEQVGFARDRGNKEVALTACEKLRKLLGAMRLGGTIHYGKTLMNIANAYRAFGRYEEAEALFKEIEQLYKQILPVVSYDYAPLYNNWSILALDMGDPERAAELIRTALSFVDRYDDARIEQATSRVNLACVLMGIAAGGGKDSEDMLTEASAYLDDAIGRFEAAGGRDYHYASALSARGDLKVKDGQYEEAAADYRLALELVKLYTGENSKTRALEAKITEVEAKIE